MMLINPSDAAHYFNALDKVLRIEELYLLQRVAQKINSTLDLDLLLDQIVGDVAKTFGYDRLAVLLKDDNTDELVIAAGWTGELCLKGTRFKIDQEAGMSAHAAASGLPRVVPSLRTKSGIFRTCTRAIRVELIFNLGSPYLLRTTDPPNALPPAIIVGFQNKTIPLLLYGTPSGCGTITYERLYASGLHKRTGYPKRQKVLRCLAHSLPVEEFGRDGADSIAACHLFDSGESGVPERNAEIKLG